MSTKLEGIYLSAEKLKNLNFVLDYIIDAEERSYEEYVFQIFEDKLLKDTANDYDYVLDNNNYNRVNIEHIYAIARRVKDAIDL